jgi:hypothetical protein
MKPEEKVVELLQKILDRLEGKKIACSRFIDNGNGTVTDTKTGLIWVKNPHTDLSAVFKSEMNWKDAKAACEKLGFAGHKDWRLPTVAELFSIVDHTKDAEVNESAIDIAVFPDTKCSWYWSSTPIAWSSGFAWFVAFGSGLVVGYGKGHGGYVRPVRASK